MPLTIGGLGPRSDHRDAVFVNAGPVDEAAALYALAKAGETLARNIRRAGPDTGALIALQRGEKQRRRYSGKERRCRRGQVLRIVCREPLLHGGGGADHRGKPVRGQIAHRHTPNRGLGLRYV